MARGSKASYSSKQKRQAKHIEDSAKSGGKSAKTAKRIAWATVNKETGGVHKGMKSSSPSKKGGQKSGKAASHPRRHGGSHASHSSQAHR